MSTHLKRTLHDNEAEAHETFTSSPITDRSSTFIAHFHPYIPAGDHGFLIPKSTSFTSDIKSFQSHPAFSFADHRMVAWRRPSSQRTLGTGAINAPITTTGKTVNTTGSDDDGEKHAGKRLERVLSDLDVHGVVVVARWYGGTLLGPIRFTHIENVAKEAITKWKSSRPSIGDDVKRRKVGVQDDVMDISAQQEDTTQRAKLAKQLAERDNSIAVLRGLLAEKTANLNSKSSSNFVDPHKSESSETASIPTSGSSPPAASASPSAKKIEYSEMPLQRLRQLEKARDATISFILKQIDKAEEEERKWKASNEGEDESER
ncbi:uncharacterized protein Z518_05786 [Rhinocladiella mackenziei CBS 650.93]|uniref:Impact N-terminal domain-containing protein n=1 Tax=Rhinocladiella mackenziei CBS 650.93 TaxID=1442369 RepID=A0A0D2J749_9EURO|nr:uncharacterized protein Z518_05786 [Rhinocladiella mackenziei CBS 650.93]KIX04915.1 hypothetical protein Z518_05786 [Rhinocladiella mackenziei CBS 650.93]